MKTVPLYSPAVVYMDLGGVRLGHGQFRQGVPGAVDPAGALRDVS